jgi:hypothetical protein
MGYTNTIDQNDVSYVYVKTGQWIKPLATAQAQSEPGDLLVVTKTSPTNKLEPSQTVLFASGPVHVISERR